MALLPGLPNPAHLSDLFARFPDTVPPLMDITDAVLRSDSELSIADRELLAAYVSGLNACDFCMQSHAIYAETFGVEPHILDALLQELGLVGHGRCRSVKIRDLFLHIDIAIDRDQVRHALSDQHLEAIGFVFGVLLVGFVEILLVNRETELMVAGRYFDACERSFLE